MKILFLITKAEVGGAQKMILALAKGCKQHGHEVHVGFGANTGQFLKEELKKEAIPFHSFQFLSRSFSPFHLLKFQRELSHFLDKNTFDVIHLNSSNTLPAAKIAKTHHPNIKTVFTFRGLSYLDPGSHKHLLKFFFKKYYQKYLPFVDDTVFVSHTNMEYAHTIQLSKSKHVVYNAPKNTYLSKEGARKKIEQLLHKEKGFFEGKKIIASIGRLAYPKNYEFVLENFPTLLKIYPHILFVLFGQGPEYNTYQKIIQKKNIADHVFLLQEDNAAQFMKAFDIFVLPSLYEGLSITLIEALQAHIPIVTSDVGGSHEVVNDDPHQLFESENAKEFHQRIFAFLQEGQLYSDTKEKNAAFSHHFLVQTMIEKYLTIYTKKQLK